MKLASYRNHSGEVRIGLKLGEKLADLTGAFEKYLVEDRGVLVQNAVEAARTRMPTSMQQLIERDEEGLADLSDIATYLGKAHQEGEILYAPSGAKIIYGLKEVQLLKPIPQVRRCLNININYPAFHKVTPLIGPEEGKACVFLVLPEATIGPGDIVEVPQSAEEIAVEVELGVIIGKQGKRISQAEALDFVWGYTVVAHLCGIDIISKAIGTGTECFPGGYYLIRAHNFDTFQSFGPYVALKNEIPNPQDVKGELRVNGEPKIKGNSEDMLCSVPRLLEFLSEDITLYPGDVLATGGMGSEAFPPQIQLRSGDAVEAEIDKIGMLNFSVGG